MLDKVTAIYGLFDPRSSDVIMYVGKGLEKRAVQHWQKFSFNGKAVNALLRRWFERLRIEGVEPGWRFLEENVVDWQKAERRLIYYWRFENPQLCNVADGGNAYPDIAGKIGGAIGGKISGKKNALSGHCARIATIGGRNNIEANGCRLTFNDRSKGGKNSKGGRVGGRTNAESGHCARIASLGGLLTGLKVCHQRWHVNRGIVNPTCKLCQEALNVARVS